jgi:glycosyltransferase involved in cell wall biosynthesis
MTPTRVGVNLLWLAPGEVGGSEDYCIGLLRALAQRSDMYDDLEVIVYLNGEIDATYPDLGRSFTPRRSSISGRSRPARIWAEHTWLRSTARHDGVQFVHHMGGTAPFLRGAPSVVLVHDLQPWAMPENFSALKRAYLRATVPPTVRRARAITTLSRWVQRDVHERLGVPLDRMVCLPPGAERLVGTADVPIDEAAVLDRLDIDDRPFFLYPVITYPHKNHEMLIRAFARIAPQHPDTLLVLPGGEGPAEEDVRAAIAREGVTAQVRRLGRVPNGVLEVLYRRTTALTFPSRYEGFGMAVLEVMAEGRPVIASTAGALPEVVGEGGVLLDPDATTAWATAMDTLLRERGRWQELARAATDRAAMFSWDRTVDDLVSLYRRIGRGSARGAAAS